MEAVQNLINDFLESLVFLFERLNWTDILDLALVTLVFFVILLLLRETQGIMLLRGMLLLLVLLIALSSLDILPAFSWLLNTTLPALLLAIPVIFAPEIRRGLERLGRARLVRMNDQASSEMLEMVATVTQAASRLSDRRHGALIVIQRLDSLEEFVSTGVRLNANLTTELILQIFYPNTPLHDGAVIISRNRLIAASCVMPLSASGVLTRTPDRQMGLRHRAALGISEVSDAVVVVVSEETGQISVVHSGRMIRRLDIERLENILLAFYRPPSKSKSLSAFLTRLFVEEKSSQGEIR